MIDLEQLHDCYVTTDSKIVLLVVDGLGGFGPPGHRQVGTGNGPHP